MINIQSIGNISASVGFIIKDALQTLPWRSLLGKCQTDSRYTSKRHVIYVISTAFPYVEWHENHKCSIHFCGHPYRILRESCEYCSKHQQNIIYALSDVYPPLHPLSQESHVLGGVTWIPAASGVPRNFFSGGGCSTNSVEDRGQRWRGSGGCSPLVRGSGGSCNLVQEISFHIVKFS